MTSILKTLTYIFLFMLFFTNSTFAQDKPQAVIIFDASGSMWGQIDGKAKITIAKEALNSVVKEWSPDVELGLTAYGHRKKGDCNDIEALVPVGKVDKKKIISLVEKIQPKGKTPIARSLRKVAEELKFTEEKATIILISDGKESCDANPCDVAKELEKKGIDFVTHVVGFNVDKKTDKELECIAKATGGEYFSAKNATALNAAMKSIVKKVEKVEPKPKVLKNNIEITAVEKEGGRWIKAYHTIYKVVDGEKESGRVTGCNSYKKEACIEQIPVGKYIMKSTYNEFKKETEFELKAGEVTKLNIVFGQTSKVEITAVEKEGGRWIKAYHTIYKVVDGEKESGRVTGCNSYKKEACIEQIPVGKYIITSTYNEFKKETPFELKAGEMAKINVIMGQTGKVEITTSEKEGGRWIKSYHTIHKVVDGEKESSRTTGCYSYKKEACLEQIPVGKYIINSTYNSLKKETPFEVKAGETTKVHIVFEQFQINTKCTKKNSRVSYEIYANNGRLVHEAQLVCSKVLQLTLNKGDYTIEAKVGNGSKEEKFTIGGANNKLTIDLTNVNHEAEIKADTQASTPKETKTQKKEVNLGELGAMFSQVANESNGTHSEDMKEVGALLKGLGGLLGSSQSKSSKEDLAKEKEQKSQNSEADKEFDDLSKDLDMFSK